MIVRRLTHNVYDVFSGNGWNTWSRVKTTRHYTYCIDGYKLRREALYILNYVLHPRLPINYHMDLLQQQRALAQICGSR